MQTNYSVDKLLLSKVKFILSLTDLIYKAF